MFWAEILANKFKEKSPHIVADGKTPSGKIHVGSLRGVLIHDFVHKALLEVGADSKYLYYFDDFDPMDGLPVYLDQEKYSQFMGRPLKDIPSPEGEGSYADYYAKDFIDVFNKLGAEPEILSTFNLYKDGKMDEPIKIALDNAEKIQEIYHRVSGSQKKNGWLPFQPVCPQCGKIGTTAATNWDGRQVEFSCEPDLVEWAKGCGYQGKIPPFGGTGKLPWKVEWPAKWLVLGTSLEGAGKDHSSSGGTRDVGEHIMKEVFKKDPPANIPYEHILIGGRKMSSSKGWGSSAADAADLLPPEVLRFLFARVPYQRAIDFDPTNPTTIPDLFDEFDRGQKAFFSRDNPDLAATWEAAQIVEVKEKFNLRFNLIKELLKNLKTEGDILEEARLQKESQLANEETKAIRERIKYAQIWLEKFSGEEIVTEISDSSIDLTKEQLSLLKVLAQELSEKFSDDEIQNFIYNKGKDLGLQTREAFASIYKSLLGVEKGPRAGNLVKNLGVEKVKERFRQLTESKND